MNRRTETPQENTTNLMEWMKGRTYLYSAVLVVAAISGATRYRALEIAEVDALKKKEGKRELILNKEIRTRFIDAQREKERLQKTDLTEIGCSSLLEIP